MGVDRTACGLVEPDEGKCGAQLEAAGLLLLLADEPTGNLDPKTADHLFGTLTALVNASRALVATHIYDA